MHRILAQAMTLADVARMCEATESDSVQMLGWLLAGLHESSDLLSLGGVVGAKSIEDAA